MGWQRIAQIEFRWRNHIFRMLVKILGIRMWILAKIAPAHNPKRECFRLPTQPTGRLSINGKIVPIAATDFAAMPLDAAQAKVYGITKRRCWHWTSKGWAQARAFIAGVGTRRGNRSQAACRRTAATTTQSSQVSTSSSRSSPPCSIETIACSRTFGLA